MEEKMGRKGKKGEDFCCCIYLFVPAKLLQKGCEAKLPYQSSDNRIVILQDHVMWHWGKDTGEREQRGTNISGQSWAGCTVNHNLGEKKFFKKF